MRQWYTGEIRPDDPIAIRGIPAWQRIVDRVVVQPDGCWIWPGATARGYGTIRDGGSTRYAHRVVYEHFRGEIAKSELDHLCHTRDKACSGGWGCPHRRCVNPDHLEPVTSSENQLRGRAPDLARRRAASVTHCPQGHEYTPENTYVNPGSGGRRCRACILIQGRDKYRRKHPVRRPLGPKLTSAQVLEIRARRAAGERPEDIAPDYGVSRGTIYSAVRGSEAYKAL